MSSIQYTIRDIPENLDKIIRKRAKRQNKSFNKTVVELLELQIYQKKSSQKSDIYASLFGSKTLDEKFFEEIEAQSVIDKDIWK